MAGQRYQTGSPARVEIPLASTGLSTIIQPDALRVLQMNFLPFLQCRHDADVNSTEFFVCPFCCRCQTGGLSRTA